MTDQKKTSTPAKDATKEPTSKVASGLIRCTVVVAALEGFKGFNSGAYHRNVETTDAFGQKTMSTEYVPGLFFANGTTVVDLDEKQIASIRRDVAAGQRIQLVIGEAAPVAPADDGGGMEPNPASNPGRPLTGIKTE